MNEWVTVNEPPNVGESASTPTWIFAHGAGADKDHEFMSRVATGLAERGIRVVRFNFPYMIKRSQDGKRRPPTKRPHYWPLILKSLSNGQINPWSLG